MTALCEFQERFNNIMNTYKGIHTDWKAKYKDLSFLADDMNTAAASRRYPRKQETQFQWYSLYKEVVEELHRAITLY